MPALRYDAADRHVHERRDRRRLPRQRPRLVCDHRPGETLEQGWRVGVGFDNFKKIFTDPLVRDPFISVFLWTFVYAGVSVLLTFAFGLFLAITLNKSGLRLRRRSGRCS